MEKSDPILRHTVTRTEGPKGQQRDRGIIGNAKYLARDIGPRPPGSAKERSAIRYVERELSALGFSIKTQHFQSPASTAWSESIDHLLLIIGVLLFPVLGHFSFGLVFIGFFLFLLEEYGRSPFTWLQPHRQSGNVVAKIKPLHNPRAIVVLAAHTDSPRSAFYYHPAMVHFFRTFLLLDFICQAALFMLITTIFAGNLLKMNRDVLLLAWQLSLILLIIPILALIATFSKAVKGKATPGGNNNASGVAALLELARIYANRDRQSVV